MNKAVALVLFILLLGAVAWWVLKGRPQAPAPYAERLLGAQKEAGIDRVEGDFRALNTALTSYAATEGSYPQGDLGHTLSSYMPRVPAHDPWGKGYRYTRLAENDYELRSAGPDGAFDTGDDIVMETGTIQSP